MLPGCPALAGDVGPLVLARLAGRLLQVEAGGGEVVQPLSLRVKHNLHLLLSIQPSLGLYIAVLPNNESNVDIMTLLKDYIIIIIIIALGLNTVPASLVVDD